MPIKNRITEKLINEIILIHPVLFLGNRKRVTVNCLPNILSSLYPFVIRCLAPELKPSQGRAISISKFPSYLGAWKSRERLHVLVALQTLTLA